jgi:hypothetical protein
MGTMQYKNELIDATLIEARRSGRGYMMEVRATDGRTLWGTMPRAMHDNFEIGQRVVFTATTNDVDDHFARPALVL